MSDFTWLKSKRMTASGNVKGGSTAPNSAVYGVFLNSTVSAGYMQLKDGGASGATLLWVDTPASATLTPAALSWPQPLGPFGTDIYCTLSNATCTVVYD